MGAREFTVTIAIAAPPERIRAIMTEVERWPEWTPSIRRVVPLQAGPPAVGSRYRVHQPGLPPAFWQVSALDAGGFTWVSRAPGVTVTAHHRVEPAPGGGRATLTIIYAGLFGPLLAWLTRGVNRRYLDLEAAGLKRRSESEP